MTLKSGKLQYMNLDEIESKMEEEVDLRERRDEIKKKVNRKNKRLNKRGR